MDGCGHCFEWGRATLHILMLALVLSGGGLFGAWQAGAWSVLVDHIRPDLIVGASVGSLNGYVIASGGTPEELAEYVARSRIRPFRGSAVQHPPDDGALYAPDPVRDHRYRTAADEAPDLSRFRNYLAASGRVLRASAGAAAGPHRDAVVFRWRAAGSAAVMGSGRAGSDPDHRAPGAAAAAVLVAGAGDPCFSRVAGPQSSGSTGDRRSARSVPASLSARSATPSSGSAATSNAGSTREPRTRRFF